MGQPRVAQVSGGTVPTTAPPLVPPPPPRPPTPGDPLQGSFFLALIVIITVDYY